jgi:hypothetical protein
MTSCDACRDRLRDLGAIRSAAGTLGPIQPPDHLWIEIAGRIRLDQPAPSVREVRSAVSTRRAAWQWIGLAAALLLVTLPVYWLARGDRAQNASTTIHGSDRGNAAASPAVESVEDDLKQAEAHYASAIAKLEAITQQSDSEISPDVEAKLKQSLTTLNLAIAESQTALTTNPDSVPARDSLFDALRRKISVLQDTVALMNVMRNGDQAGAAKLVGRKSAS